MWEKGKPRPIEFMIRGYGVPEMMEILARWDQLSEVEKTELGFTDSPQMQSSASRARGSERALVR